MSDHQQAILIPSSSLNSWERLQTPHYKGALTEIAFASGHKLIALSGNREPQAKYAAYVNMKQKVLAIPSRTDICGGEEES